MNIITSLLLFFNCCFSLISTAATIGDLKEFKTCNPISEGIKLTFKDQGTKFNYQIDDSERKISTYGQSVEIKNGQKCQFVAKGLIITITPSENSSASFVITKSLNFQSMGGVKSTETFTLLVEGDNIIYGNKTIIVVP
jgi:hypothetical protein